MLVLCIVLTIGILGLNVDYYLRSDRIEDPVAFVFGIVLTVISLFMIVLVYSKYKKIEQIDDMFVSLPPKPLCKPRCYFICSGNATSHKYGLFNYVKMKIVLPPIYDELKWVENGDGKYKLLNASLNGYPIIIDVNGNKYE